MTGRSLRFEEVNVGDRLPELVLPVTATRIVAGAIATRDFMPVHHDRDYANSQGAPDIFMNIISINAYCSRFLTDWAGPDAMIRRLAVRLGVPVFPGSALTFSGEVTETSGVDDGSGDGSGLVTVALRATTELGDHASGSAAVSLPVLTPGRRSP